MKKSISEAQVKRMRNLVTKKYGAKTEIRAGYTKTRELRKEGEVWEERGKTWTIKNGIKQNITKLSLARKAFKKPICCPKCNGSLKHWLSSKMWQIHKMCFKCVVKFETQLRIDGRYKEYETSIMKGNFDSWLKSITEEYKEWLNTDEANSYISEAGHKEDWGKDDKTIKSKTIEKNITRLTSEFKESIDG